MISCRLAYWVTPVSPAHEHLDVHGGLSARWSIKYRNAGRIQKEFVRGSRLLVPPGTKPIRSVGNKLSRPKASDFLQYNHVL